MAARPTWRGHLRLSLVSCPVALYPATSAAGDVHFHLVNPKTQNRIRMVPTDPDAGPVERGDLVKGYEVEKERYILLDDADLASVKLETTRTLDIERFVLADEIDRLYWKDPFFLAPDGELAADAYTVIREAMAATGRIALGRLALHARERVMALEPHGAGLVAWSLRSHNEVRDAAEVFDAIPHVRPDKGMIDIAEKIIDQKSAAFDPSKFTDRYEEALKALIAAKRKGSKPKAISDPEDTDVTDLMAALRASLANSNTPQAATRTPARGKRAGGASAPARRPTSRRKAG